MDNKMINLDQLRMTVERVAAKKIDKIDGKPGEVIGFDEDGNLAAIEIVNTTLPVKAPIGAIIWWSGTEANIPAGWHLCDGTDGTIDLRGKFILAASEGHPVGDTGGSEEVALTVEQMPEHSHVLDFYHEDNTSAMSVALGGYDRSANTMTSLTNTKKSTHTVRSVDINVIENTGGSQPHPNMPPYYTLCAIQKISADDTDVPTYEPGAGVSFTEMAGGIKIDVDCPNVPISRAEYDAMTDEEKDGKVWIVDEPQWIPTTISVQDYNTDDGWHVRKYSDGYVEMSHTTLLNRPVFNHATSSTDGAYYCVIRNTIDLPVSLVERYTLQMCVTNTGDSGNGYTLTGSSDNDPLEKAPQMSVNSTFDASPTANSAWVTGLKGLTFVTGRWK